MDWGSPKAEMEIFKGASEVYEGHRKVTWKVVSDDVIRLVVKDTDDDALYRIVLENKVGKDETKAQVTVLSEWGRGWVNEGRGVE